MPFAPSISVLTSVYRGEKYLASFLDNLQAQTIFPELELVLILNEANPGELKTAKQFGRRFPEQVQVLEVTQVESLGASWNRGWLSARAPYLAIWNIDDRREIDSLQRQLTTLEAEPDSVLCYGDYVAVPSYGERQGTRRNTPLYSVSHFRRAFAQGGAFWLLRKTVADNIGWFDEQFRVGVDMEYSFRIAANALSMSRCEGLLGYFTDAEQGLSTRQGVHEALVERTAIQLRYGVYDKVRRDLMDEARRFRLGEVQTAGKWLPLTRYVPHYSDYLARQKNLWFVGTVRNGGRKLLQKIGILPMIYRIQERFLKREI